MSAGFSLESRWNQRLMFGSRLELGLSWFGEHRDTDKLKCDSHHDLKWMKFIHELIVLLTVTIISN